MCGLVRGWRRGRAQDRLQSTKMMALLLPPALVTYAWTVENRVHGPAACMLLLLIGFSMYGTCPLADCGWHWCSQIDIFEHSGVYCGREHGALVNCRCNEQRLQGHVGVHCR